MRKYWYQLVILIVLFLIEIAALGVFSRADVWFPQLLLLAVIIFALKHSLSEIVWFSFVTGFLGELFSGFFFGTWILAFLATGIIIYFITRKLTSRDISFVTVVFIVTVSTLFFPLWAFFYSGLLSLVQISDPITFGDFYRVSILWTVLSNLVVFYPLNHAFKFFAKLG